MVLPTRPSLLHQFHRELFCFPDNLALNQIRQFLKTLGTNTPYPMWHFQELANFANYLSLTKISHAANTQQIFAPRLGIYTGQED